MPNASCACSQRATPARGAISLIVPENGETSRLMVWTPARLYTASQWAQDVLKQHPKKARGVRDGSYNDRDRLGKECVRGVRCDSSERVLMRWQLGARRYSASCMGRRAA